MLMSGLMPACACIYFLQNDPFAEQLGPSGLRQVLARATAGSYHPINDAIQQIAAMLGEDGPHCLNRHGVALELAEALRKYSQI